MDGSQPAEKPLSTCSYPRMYLTSIGFAGLPFDITPVAQSVHQFNGRMVTELHPLRMDTNCWLNVRRKAFDRKKQLMLLAVQTIFPGSLFAECEECADLIPELGERPIVLRIHNEQLYIAVRYLWNSIPSVVSPLHGARPIIDSIRPACFPSRLKEKKRSARHWVHRVEVTMRASVIPAAMSWF